MSELLKTSFKKKGIWIVLGLTIIVATLAGVVAYRQKQAGQNRSNRPAVQRGNEAKDGGKKDLNRRELLPQGERMVPDKNAPQPSDDENQDNADIEETTE